MIPFQPLKVCPCCGHSWPEIYSFLEDEKLIFIGYQEGFESLIDDFFLFLHKDDKCGSSIAIEVEDFLYHFRSIPSESETKSFNTYVIKKFCSTVDFDSIDIEERKKIVEVITRVLKTTKGLQGCINNSLRIA